MADSLEELREQIDRVDRTIVEALDERADLVQKIGEIKREEGIDLFVPGREREIIKRLEELGSGDFPAASLRLIYREIIATCLNLEKPVTVAYLGPETTFTHAAALKRFGQSTDLLPLNTVSEVFHEVEGGGARFGLVPIENSSEGAVRHTLDRFLSSELIICSECYLKIELNLVSREEALEGIEVVYSHGQAISQAREWLNRHLPGATVRETNSTAEAARLVSERSGSAAVASEVAADVYDLNLLVRNLETPADNYTRFLVLGETTPPPTGDDKTSVAFSLPDRAGALYEVLEPFGRLDINMTKIESRPSRESTWDYIFFVDFQGHRQEEPVQELIDHVKTKTRFFKVLGSYPREDPFE